MPGDSLLAPLDVGVEPDGLLVGLAGNGVLILQDSLEGIRLIAFHDVLHLFGQLVEGQLLTDDRIQGVAHGVPGADIAVQVKYPQAL